MSEVEAGASAAQREAGIDFERLFDVAPCGYVLAERNGRIIRANETFAAWTGRPAEQLVGKRFSDLLSIAGKIFYETHFAPTLHMAGSFNEVALDLVDDQGAKLPVLVNATGGLHDGEHVQILFAVFRATQRRQYEQGLLEARDKAEATIVSERATSELQEQFIAVLGHDLRNPIASIASGIHMLAKETISQRGARVVELMSGSILRANALIDNVLDFARGRLGGGITLDRNAREPLEPVLRQVVAELQSVYPKPTIETRYELADPVDCDRMRIGQLLSNLLGNALTHGAKDQPIMVDASTSRSELVIAVSNGGEPIPPQVLERLFQPFFRGDDRVKHGLGLGLHIAAEIARAHEGMLVARSDVKATTFVFTMPLDI
ncbi:PAS domain-containing sensor histidine kinase [Sphingobium sp. 3R8]|uniref:PAS domain-containing sensor histidine kinase n=1 Tax=Sphingobium sp. 3R8 TaxID=2874921 RepID=UPI001CCC43D4|nr:PAS domain-containing sensor histidine kinase [Sphingobium sp. 3R8]MBZ9648510.1 PAS domain-containing sensor histidine kinase [Sphingobium sp. 3R8]